MMFFTPENAEKVKQGTKTETRRDWKSQHVYAGRVYPVRLSRKDPVPLDAAYIRVITVYMERLGIITDDAVVREGCTSRENFFSLWKQLHKNLDLDKEIYVVRFRLATPFEIFVHQFNAVLKEYEAVSVTASDGANYVAQSYETLQSIPGVDDGHWVELTYSGKVVGKMSIQQRMNVSGKSRRQKRKTVGGMTALAE